jgi:5-methylcytosine-specific restriction endonuclease McrA
MDTRLKEEVRQRADRRCEYCRFPERFAELRFQIDHIIPQQHGGLTHADNLALACFRCNKYKGPNLPALTP